MHESRISGAEEPRAISVRLATVAFQMVTLTSRRSPVGITTSSSAVWDVICSMAIICARGPARGKTAAGW